MNRITSCLGGSLLLSVVSVTSCADQPSPSGDQPAGASGAAGAEATAGAASIVPESCVLQFVDADGDGYGVGDGVCSQEAVVVGMSRRGTDCDDTNPDISPDAAEQWRDGVDSNCDAEGADDFDCERWPDLCGCAELAAAPESVEVDESCIGADLVLKSAEQCEVCTRPWVSFVVANRGQVEASGVQVEFSQTNSNAPPYRLPGPLAPGAVSLPINAFVESGKLTLSVSSETEECNAADNAMSLSLAYYQCK